MNTVSVILVDDEQHCLDVLEWELKGLNIPLEILGSFTNPIAGKEAIHEKRPELVFLDIEMPELDGIQLLKSFNPVFFNVVFTTAYEHYALDAIKSEAIDYLLKPVNSEELRQAVGRHQSRNLDHLQQHLTSLFDRLKKQNYSNQKVVFPTSDGLQFVKVNDILRCESSSNYTNIILRDGSRIFISKTLKEVESLINSDFFSRVHKSHIINLNAIKRYTKRDGGFVVMEDESTVPISRNRKNDFFGQI